LYPPDLTVTGVTVINLGPTHLAHALRLPRISSYRITPTRHFLRCRWLMQSTVLHHSRLSIQGGLKWKCPNRNVSYFYNG